MANTPDNRKSKRSPVTLRIKFKSANLEQFIERYAVDVSQGGIFIRTKEPLPVGTTMRFEFQLRDESPLITGEGTVVWIREQNASQAGVAPGMGVRFDRLTEPSQAVLDEILAYKAARGANGVATPIGEMPTRVVPAGPRKDGPGAHMPFAGEGVPEEAFEQATKVHSLEELAELSARPEAGKPGPRNTGSMAPTERYPAGFDPVTDYAETDDDKTKVYPALSRPGGRQTGPNLDLGASGIGVTQRLPPIPASPGPEVELGRAGYDEDVDDDELPFDTRDVELGMAGPTAQLAHERVIRSDEVELGHAGVTQPLDMRRAPAPRPAAGAAPAKAPAQPQPRVIPLGDLGDLGESGASDPMSDVPLPEAGHFDLGQAGPTMQLKAERLGRDAELELGAAGSNEDAEVVTAALPAVPSKDREPAQRPIQPAVVASAAAAARMPASPDPEAREETQERASDVLDELAARRPDRRDSDVPVSSAEPAEAEAEGDEIPEDDEVAAAASPAYAEERAARSSGPVLRVSTRNGTEKVPVKKGLPAGLLVAVAAVILLVGAGALYLFTRDTTSPGPETAEVPTPPATDPTTPPATPDTPPTPPGPDQPSTNPSAVAPAATPDAAAAAAVEDPEIEIEPEQPDEPAVPVETVQLEVRSVPPGATAALIDGDQSGPTPMKFTLDKSKKHRVRVSLQGYTSQEIELDPARRQPARVTLAPMPWILRFESTPPKAFVYVDGRRVVGETPNEFQLPAGWEKKKHLKISFRLPHHQKLDLVVDPAFAAEGETMVQTVRGALVPGEPAPHRPAPSRPANQPAPDGQPTPPAGGEGQGGGAADPAPAPAEPPKADPPPAPEGQAADPPAQP